MRVRILILLLFQIPFILFINASSYPYRVINRWDSKISEGVCYSHIKAIAEGRIVQIYILKIFPQVVGLKISLELAERRIGAVADVGEITLSTGGIAGINGSFFTKGRFPTLPIGHVIKDGRLAYFDNKCKVACGFFDDPPYIDFGKVEIKGKLVMENSSKRKYPILGLNRPRKKDELVIYTRDWGYLTNTNYWGKEIIVEGNNVKAMTLGGSYIPNSGFVISTHGKYNIVFEHLQYYQTVNLEFYITNGWEKVRQLLCGGKMLVKEDKVVVGRGGKREPLTSVGITREGYILFVVVDGRQKNYSYGLTCYGLANIMKRFGVVNAATLDGGGSSTMFILNKIVNRPSDGKPRKVVNALVIKQL